MMVNVLLAALFASSAVAKDRPTVIVGYYTFTTTLTPMDSSAESPDYLRKIAKPLGSTPGGSLNQGSWAYDYWGSGESSGHHATGSSGSFLQIWQWIVVGLLACCCCCACVGLIAGSKKKRPVKPQSRSRPIQTAAPAPAPEPEVLLPPPMPMQMAPFVPMTMAPPVMMQQAPITYSYVPLPVPTQTYGPITYSYVPAPVTTSFMQRDSYVPPFTSSYIQQAAPVQYTQQAAPVQYTGYM